MLDPVFGVCSWSLLPESPAALAHAVRACGLSEVQLALDPIRRGEWGLSATREALSREGVRIGSGMMSPVGEDYASLESIRRTGGLAPDSTWEENLRAAEENARIAQELGVRLVTLHAGEIPHHATSARREVILGRIRLVAEMFGRCGVRIALETGREDAATLAQALDELDGLGVGVNFDPANVILYGAGDPHKAFIRVAARVVQVHVKDATAPRRAGEWGMERVVGEGEVRWPEFLRAARRLAPGAALVIEREAGDRRIEDVRTARAVVERVLSNEGGAR